MTLSFDEEYKKQLMGVYNNPSKELFGKGVDFWLTKIAKQEYSDRTLIELVSERDSLRSLIKELVEDGERLEKEAISEWHAPEGALSFECEFCESGFFESREAVKHSDNCPLNQHLALMQKVKEVFPITEEKRDASAPTGLSKEALLRIAEGTSGNLDHLGGINGG